MELLTLLVSLLLLHTLDTTPRNVLERLNNEDWHEREKASRDADQLDLPSLCVNQANTDLSPEQRSRLLNSSRKKWDRLIEEVGNAVPNLANDINRFPKPEPNVWEPNWADEAKENGEPIWDHREP